MLAGDDATILISDETMLRMFPPLRAAWAKQGQQAHVRISGQNARRVLIGAINVRTGHRIVTVARSLRNASFEDFLVEVRRRYRAGELHIILDQHGSHTSKTTERLAERLGIKLHTLPKKSPELNSMDHLWRHLKEHVAANRQHENVDELAHDALRWILSLDRRDAMTKAGLMAPNAWLKRVSQNLRGPT
jgi:transposase